MSIEVIIFYLLVIDSITANLVAWTGDAWYKRHFRLISRYFPVTKGWTTYYLVLVALIGFLIYKMGGFGL